MKRFIIFAILALTLSGQLMAQDSSEKDSYDQDNYVYVSPATVYIKSNTLQGSLVVWLDNVTADFNSYMMDIYLPEGFTIPTKGDSNDYDITVNTEKTPGHTVRVTQRSDGSYRVIGFSLTGTPIATGEAVLFTAMIQAPATFDTSSDNVEGTIENINIAAGTSGEPAHYFPDATFSMEYSTVTGIHNVEATDIALPANIYTLQGVCVKQNASQEEIDALTPGIYIVAGKKVVVK